MIGPNDIVVAKATNAYHLYSVNIFVCIFGAICDIMAAKTSLNLNILSPLYQKWSSLWHDDSKNAYLKRISSNRPH